jgi:Uma2 family endonuclease
MQWKELVHNPHLQNLPYKIETNQWGQIVLTPAKNRHGAYQSKIATVLDDLLDEDGMIVTESAIQTTQGTKVADVAWYSAERWAIVEDEFDSSVAAEICVEVRSPGNSAEEMKLKRELYFTAGAMEVWVCDTQGRVRFYNPAGELPASALVPTFPKQIKL